ncbi:MAG: carbon-nitrogen hydrolase family protein [Mariprofundaceae bacterium]|nr:carbon-nitrogen hydrolase family protein [Mariprofundaceae bacterium]
MTLPAAMKIACIQMSARPTWQENSITLQNSIAQAAAQGATTVLLPEDFAAIAGDQAQRQVVSHPDTTTSICNSLKQWAKEHSIWLIAGGFLYHSEHQHPLPYNRCLVINPDGCIVTHYDKIHLFDADVDDGISYRESNYVRPGMQPTTVDIEAWRLGLSICYDLRFPELYRHYSRQGCHALVVPAAFTHTTGQAHWEVLLRARAIENQCYVIAAGQSGHHAGARRTWGHSMVIDPWGKIIAQCAEEDNAIITATLDPTLLTQCRTQLPTLPHRRMG